MTDRQFNETPRRRRPLAFVAWLALAPLGLVTVAWLNAGSLRLGDLITFFIPLLLCASLVAAIVAFVVAGRLAVVTAVVLIAINGFPLVAPAGQAASSASGQTLRIATSNILAGRDDYQRVIDWSTGSGIDVLGQQEVNDDELHQLAALRSHFSATPATAVLGRNPEVTAWSNWPILKAGWVAGTSSDPDFGIGGATLRLELAAPPTATTVGAPAAGADRPLTAVVVYVLHPSTPRSAELWSHRNAYLKTVAAAIAAEPAGTAIVAMGDFNTPNWSPYFRRFLDDTQLVDAAETSWPMVTRFSLRFRDLVHLGAPVDHILVSRAIEVKHFEVGPDIGSDHLPLLADLRLP